jgi:hypothetical protein
LLDFIAIERNNLELYMEEMKRKSPGLGRY